MGKFRPNVLQVQVWFDLDFDTLFCALKRVSKFT